MVRAKDNVPTVKKSAKNWIKVGAKYIFETNAFINTSIMTDIVGTTKNANTSAQI